MKGHLFAVAPVAVALVLTATAEGATTNFVSKRYGYSLALTGGSARYILTPASTNWSGSGPSPSDPAFDQIDDLQTHSSYMVASKPIPPGWTLRKWMSSTRSITVPPCTYKRTLAKSNVDGAPALAYELKCAEGVVFQLAAIHAQRGYLIIVAADASVQRAFNAARRSFRFLGD